jgi:Sulfotransferase family
MTMPNFFIIGAQKAGTTSLYHYLNQHPQVYMSPVKEPFFFSHRIDPDGQVVKERFGGPVRERKPKLANLDEYRALFEGVEDEKAIGEASPLYHYAPGTAERIKKFVPEAKAIALLRNPADRAYSAFLYAVRIGSEPLTDFGRALREEENRIRAHWHYSLHYRNRGYYYAQIKRYYEVFGRERVGVWLYEDLKDDPVGVAQSVFRFLGVDDAFIPDTSSKYNPALVPKGETGRVAIRVMNATLPVVGKVVPSAHKVRRLVNRRMLTDELPPIDPEIRRDLLEGYREDILKLQALIGRDLSAWLTEEDKG